MLTSVAWAACAGLAVGLAASPWASWEAWGVGLAGLWTGSPGVVLGLFLTGTAIGLWRYEARRRQTFEKREAEAERFLEQVRFLATQEPNLQRVLDQAAGDAFGAHRRAPEARQMLEQLRAAVPVPAVTALAEAWPVLSKHGGRLVPVVDQILEQLRLERRLRWELDAQLAGPHGTLLLLAGAPWLTLLAFRWMVPGFYLAIASSIWGWCALAWTGGTTLVALWLARKGRQTFGYDVG